MPPQLSHQAYQNWTNDDKNSLMFAQLNHHRKNSLIFKKAEVNLCKYLYETILLSEMREGSGINRKN